LYTGLYGTNYSGPTRPHGDTTESAGVPFQSRPNPSRNPYTSGFFDEYAPHLGPMAMSGKNYQPYDDPAIQHILRSSQPLTPEPEDPNAFEPGVRYEDSRMDEDLFKSQMELLREQFGEDALKQWDNNEVASRILQARNEEETSEFDAGQREDLLEIQMAVEQIKAEHSLESNREVSVAGVYGYDADMYQRPNPESMYEAVDYEMFEPQDFFEQQMEMLEIQFSQFDPTEYDSRAEMEAMSKAQEAMFDLPDLEAAFMEPPIEAMEPLTGSGLDSLEQMVEANGMGPEAMMPDAIPGGPDYEESLMIPELFDQEMSDAVEPVEPYPDPMQHYGGMMPQEMYDEQLDIMDPYMMPGMIDPYMMPGPFGPGPMLDPGPGGPP